MKCGLADSEVRFDLGQLREDWYMESNDRNEPEAELDEIRY